jgi:hypothetical protein
MGPPRWRPGTPDQGRAARGRTVAPGAGLCRGRGDAPGAGLRGGGASWAGGGLPRPGEGARRRREEEKEEVREGGAYRGLDERQQPQLR